MKKLLKVLGVLVLLVLVLIGVLAYNTFTFPSRQIKVAPVKATGLDMKAAAQRLGGAIRLPTISNMDRTKMDRSVFEAFHAYLAAQYPLVHQKLKLDKVNSLSLLFTWPGSDKNLEPIILTAHMDVVPVIPGSESQWSQPPFSGNLAGGYIWGRGSLDDKVSLLGILEAVENLLATGFEPQRTIYLAFGHDEEVGGQQGAVKIAALLENRGVKAAAVLDESGVVVSGLVPGVTKPVALIGVAEKGYLSLKLTAHSPGGHSSMPPAHTAIGRVATAVSRLEEEPFPAKYDDLTSLLFQWVGPEMSLPMKAVFANDWLLSPVIKGQLAAKPSTDASLRTTTAPTIFKAGSKDNVLPSSAQAVVNFRILPGDTIHSVTARVNKVIADPAVKVEPFDQGNEATKVSDCNSASFKTLQKTAAQVFPDAIIAPYLVMAGTDARHYQAVSDFIWRFLPVRFGPEDLDRLHGTNERLKVKDYLETINFYRQYIINWCS